MSLFLVMESNFDSFAALVVAAWDAGTWVPVTGTALASTALAFVISELVARAWIARRDDWFVHAPFVRRKFHIATEVIPALPPESDFSSNADGERGDPVPADPEATLRVLVAGGSAAECFLLDQEDSWPMITQRELEALERGGRAVHVGNIARSLIACRTIDALLQKVLPRFRGLDAIVLMVGASDMVAWLEADTPERLGDAPVDLTQHCDEHPQGPFGWKPKATAIYRLLRRLNTRLRKPLDVRHNVGRSIAKHRAMRAAATTLLDEVPDPSPMLDGFETHLTSLIATCRRFAPRIIIARQPWMDREFTPEEAAQLWNFGQGSPYRGHLDTYYTHRVVRDLMEKIDAVAARVAIATGAESVDLRPVVPSDFEHYYDFLHHTPLGNRRVAEAIARQIEARATAPHPTPVPSLLGTASRADEGPGGQAPVRAMHRAQ